VIRRFVDHGTAYAEAMNNATEYVLENHEAAMKLSGIAAQGVVFIPGVNCLGQRAPAQRRRESAAAFRR
jgi:hypothetical protein